jgi:hypothetical protein
MRAHRRFQPMLDSMPIRIAPSSLSLSGSAPAVVQTAGASSPALHAMADDTVPTGGSHSALIILESVSPPTTLTC